MANDRISQNVVEALVDGNPKARNSQNVIESLVIGTPKARISQNVVEILARVGSLARSSQNVIEALCEVPHTPIEESTTNTITFAHSVSFNFTNFIDVSNTITFTNTATYNSVLPKSASNTITFSNIANIGDVFLEHPRNTITFGHNVSAIRIRNRSTSNTLTVSGLVRRILTLSATNNIVLGQLEDEDYCHVAISNLVLTEDNDVDIFKVRYAYSNPGFSHTVLCNTLLNLSAENSIVFDHILHRILTLSASNSIIFTNIVGVVASKYVSHTIAFTQIVTSNIIYNRDLGQNLGLYTDLFLNKTINKRMLNVFNIAHRGRLLHVLNKSVNNSLSLTQELLRERFIRSVSNTIVMFQSISHIHIHNKSASNTLGFGQSVSRNVIYGLHPNNVIDFTKPYKKKIKIGNLTEIEIPKAIGTIVRTGYIYDCNNYPVLRNRKQNYMVLEVPEQAVILPAPLFGNREGNTDIFTMSFGMNGTIYTTIKKSEIKAFSFEWDISVRKSEELSDFLFNHNTKAIKITTWDGLIWIARLMSNPIQFTDNLRTADCDSKVIVALDFEGLRIH